MRIQGYQTELKRCPVPLKRNAKTSPRFNILPADTLSIANQTDKTVAQGRGEIATPVSYSEIYEQMNSKTINRGIGNPIDAEVLDLNIKTASAEPSDEQIKDLQNKYNVEDMTRDEYQSLLDDLVNNGLINEHERIQTQVTPMYAGLLPCKRDYERFTGGNILEYISKRVNFGDIATSWMNSEEYFLQEESFGTFAPTKEERADQMKNWHETQQKIYDILQKLKKE